MILGISLSPFFSTGTYIFLALPAVANSTAAQQAQDITVLLEGATQGSGVILSKEGNTYSILTAWHVIKDYVANEEIQIKTPDGNSRNYVRYKKEKVGNYDLGLLKVELRGNHAVARIDSDQELKPGAEVFVGGFPLPSSSVPKRIFRFVPGKLIARSNVQLPGGYQLLYSNQTLPGMSGGPVVDQSGGLVGIHGRAEIDAKMTEQTGIAVKTGTNQGVPINLFINRQEALQGEIDRRPVDQSLWTLINTSIEALFSKLSSWIASIFSSSSRQVQQEISNKLIKAANLLSIPGVNTGFGGADLFEANLREDEVIKLTTEILEVQPLNTHALQMRAIAQSRIRPYLKQYLENLRNPSKPPEARSAPEYFYYSKLMEAEKQTEWIQAKARYMNSALDDLSEAISRDPKVAPYRSDLAMLHLKLSNFGIAISVIDEAISLDNIYPHYKYQKGLILHARPSRKADNTDYCIAMLKAAVSGSIPAVSHMGRVLRNRESDCFSGRNHPFNRDQAQRSIDALVALDEMKKPPIDKTIIHNTMLFLSFLLDRDKVSSELCSPWRFPSAPRGFKKNQVIDGIYVNPIWYSLHVKEIICRSSLLKSSNRKS